MYVVLFDGVCNLCNSSVNWIIDHDKRNEFRFASLQSDYGQQVINKFNLQGDYLNTVILVDGDRLYTRSAAVLKIAGIIGGVWGLLAVFLIVPAFIRDIVYNFIARNRYKWFGKKESCRIPTPELKSKFLG
ncbi:MAG: thiol-disulfide oxidoreductase DCC family protein [Chitinophagales bacterium]